MQNPNNANPSDADGDGNPDCNPEGILDLAWIICPVVSISAGVVEKIFHDLIAPLLEDVPVSANKNDGSYQAWQSFRFIANVLLVGSMLAIVYSQARGGE